MAIFIEWLLSNHFWTYLTNHSSSNLFLRCILLINNSFSLFQEVYRWPVLVWSLFLLFLELNFSWIYVCNFRGLPLLRHQRLIYSHSSFEIASSCLCYIYILILYQISLSSSEGKHLSSL